MLEGTDWLLLSGNNLGSLQKEEDYLNDIVSLDLSSSRITQIDETVIGIILRNIKYLDIRGNNLKYIPRTISTAESG